MSKIIEIASRGDQKKAVGPALRRKLAQYLIDAYRVSARRACGVVEPARSTFHYKPRPRTDEAL
jgi:putative transposase